MFTAAFANGTTMPYIRAEETEEYWGGSSRRTLTFECTGGSQNLDTIHALLSDESNTSTITINNGETDAQGVYSGYVLPLEISVKPVLVSSETEEAGAQYEDRLFIKLGKRTYTEAAIKAQSAQLEAALAQATYTAMMSNTLLEG